LNLGEVAHCACYSRSVAQPGHVLILSGPPGSGKSTIADLLTRGDRPAVHLHSDDFFERTIKGGFVPPWLPASQAQNETVTRALAAAAFAFAAGDYAVVLDGIVGPWFLDPYRDAARVHGVRLHYAVLRSDVELSVRRVMARSTPGPKDAAVVRALHAQFSSLGSLESHVLDSGKGSPGSVADAVRTALAQGRLVLA
jgi:predicted kinase